MDCGPLWVEHDPQSGLVFSPNHPPAVFLENTHPARVRVRIRVWNMQHDASLAEWYALRRVKVGALPFIRRHVQGPPALLELLDSWDSEREFLVDGPLLIRQAAAPDWTADVLTRTNGIPAQAQRRLLLLVALGPLMSLGACIVHGSSFSNNRYAACIMGPSGAGKSTALTLLSSAFEPLSDDLHVAESRRTGFAVHATAFDKAYVSPAERQLGVVLLPTKGDRFGLTRLGSREAFLRYVFENSKDLGMWPAQVRRHMLPWLHNLFTRVPVFDLTFRKDCIDLDAIGRLLA